MLTWKEALLNTGRGGISVHGNALNNFHFTDGELSSGLTDITQRALGTSGMNNNLKDCFDPYGPVIIWI